eukprot:TRINITY_DN33_c0_g1_i7.p1 TRINITY_DN33_c0_g1~~TRINITY_DN33_c0_g1_i7.p1  ORF type:complete len:705 (+),score=261.77 TRINITY_DN33_c0_g1_i7:85-2199(+)
MLFKVVLLLALTGVPTDAATLRVSPVGKVVDLMKSVEAKVQEQADLEEDMFENYTCWSKRTNNAKREAIAAAQARIKMLTQRIAELKSMKGSESGEAEKLLAQLNEVNSEINSTETQRNSEAQVNEENIETTTSAVNGLSEAAETLGTVVNLAKQGKKHTQSLLSLRGSRTATMSSSVLARKAKDLENALQIAESHLSKADATFLRRILTADVSNVAVSAHGKEDPPDVAPVTEDYVARSGDILGTLDKLSGEFSADLESTKDKEAKSKEDFLKLMKEKNIEKANVEEAVRNQEREKQAREYKAKEAAKEIAALEAQIATDEEFIAAVDKAQEQKQDEWDQRSKVRSEELTALAKAIETLHSDEARDLFNSNFNSFLQRGTTSAVALQQAGSALTDAYKSTKDTRLLALSIRLASSKSEGHFDEVFTKIDEMVKVIDEEQASDEAKKKQCLDDLAQDTADVKQTKEDIEHLTNEITALNDDVEEIKMEIMNKKREIAEIANELSEATKMREEEHAEAKKAREEDEVAMQTIEAAAKLIADFYNGAKSALLQEGGSEPDLSAAPGTWESGEKYKGDQQGGGRITALFDEVKADLQKDMDSAQLCEDNAQKMYDDAKSSMEKQTSQLNGEIDALMASKGEKKTSASDKATETETKEGELKALQKKMADVKPECDFFVDKYDARNKNRETEKTSLNKAKEILQKYDA